MVDVTTIKLGSSQQMALRALLEFTHYPGGWIMTNHSTTVRVLESLARKGLAERQLAESGRPRYVPTVLGIALGRARWAGSYQRGYLRPEYRG